MTKPSNARVSDYLLGGTAHWARDQELDDRLLGLVPTLRAISLAAREFSHRVVRQLAALGAEQFLDVGCGLPTLGPVHEVAEAARPGLVRAEGVLDLDQPVVILLVGVPDLHPGDLLARYRELLAPGSFLALSPVAAGAPGAGVRGGPGVRGAGRGGAQTRLSSMLG
ncbi:SAM-dependent methyltransferase [Crossiella equi]|uniref:SAM-dependent methyltransferase n=1 Tax=Crossiella equi TaxID=130796 RepID=UPI0023EA4C41|nr:SAM-dependent methyltransferase [Crossiella equi]